MAHAKAIVVRSVAQRAALARTLGVVPARNRGGRKPTFTAEQVAQIVAVCDTYRMAAEAPMRGEHVISTDEKTGVQALERSLFAGS